MRAFPAFAFALSVLLASTAAAEDSTPPPAPEVRCEAYYRSSLSEPIQQEGAVSFHFGSYQEQGEVLFPDLALRGFFSDTPWEGRSLSVAIERRDDQARISSHLYQLPREALPANQFEGGHGFTGLVYTYHPESGAEMQFYCRVR